MRWKHDDPLAEALPAVELTDEDRACVEDVLDAAAAWAAGDIPFPQAASIGAIENWRGVPSPPYTRYMALRSTPRTDPRWDNLRRLIDVLVRAEGYIVTSCGVFRPEEIRANEAGWQYANFERAAA